MTAAQQQANHLLFLRLIALFICSLFVLSVPYAALLVLMVGSALFAMRVGRTMRIDRHAAAFALLLFYVFGWGLVTGGFHPASLAKPGFYGGEGRILIAYLPIFLIFAAPPSLFTANTIHRIFRVLYVLSLSAAVLAAGGLMNVMFGSHHAAGYASGSLLIVFVCLYSEERKKWQLFGVAVALIMLMFANSRTTMVGLALAFLLYYRSRILGPRIFLGVGVVLTGGLYIWSVVSPFSFDRFMVLLDPALWDAIGDQFSLATATENPTSQNVDRVGSYYNILTRIILWGKAILLFEQSPILGIGSFRFNDPNLSLYSVFPGLSVGISDERSLSVATAHNSYFHILAEGGVVGIGIYLMPWIMILRTLQRRSKDGSIERMMAKMGSISILFMMFGALTGHLLASPSMTLWVLLVSGLALRTKNDSLSQSIGKSE